MAEIYETKKNRFPFSEFSERGIGFFIYKSHDFCYDKKTFIDNLMFGFCMLCDLLDIYGAIIMSERAGHSDT